MKNQNIYPINILLIETKPKNFALLTLILNKTKFQYKIHIEKNLRGAIELLDIKKNKPKIDLIIIDYNSEIDYEKEIVYKINNTESIENIPFLFIQNVNNKIEIIKTFNDKFNSNKESDIKNFIETLVSLKYFIGSLYKNN